MNEKHVCAFCGAKRPAWFSRIQRLTVEVDTLRDEVSNLKQEICRRWKHDCSWRDPILWFQTGQGVVSDRDVVNFKILVARYEGCFACNRSARQTCIGIFVTNHLCPSRLLLSSLPCHHHHHHRNHHHFLAYTRPQQFSTLVLGSPLSRTLQISFLAVCDGTCDIFRSEFLSRLVPYEHSSYRHCSHDIGRQYWFDRS